MYYYIFYIECQENLFRLSLKFRTIKPLCWTAQRFFFSVDIPSTTHRVSTQSTTRKIKSKLLFPYNNTKMKQKKIRVVSKGNWKNYLAYLLDWSIQEAVKCWGLIYLAKISSDFKLIPQGEHLQKKDFILVE